MEDKLTPEQKQEIRDKIEGFKHLKEPYVITLQISFSIFVTVMLFLMGTMNAQVDKIFDINNYTISIIENQTNNVSYSSQGIITPVKSFSLSNFNNFLHNAWVVVVLLYGFMAFFLIFGTKYDYYDKQIKGLYSQLNKWESKENQIKQSWFSRLLPGIRGRSISKKEALSSLINANKGKPKQELTDLITRYGAEKCGRIILGIIWIIFGIVAWKPLGFGIALALLGIGLMFLLDAEAIDRDLSALSNLKFSS